MIIKEKIMRFPGLCRERSQTLFLVSISLIIIFALSLEWPTDISQSSIDISNTKKENKENYFIMLKPLNSSS